MDEMDADDARKRSNEAGKYEAETIIRILSGQIQDESQLGRFDTDVEVSAARLTRGVEQQVQRHFVELGFGVEMLSRRRRCLTIIVNWDDAPTSERIGIGPMMR